MPTDFVAKPPYNVLQPGAYSAVDSSLLAAPSFAAGKPIPAVIGTSFGGQPNVAMYFRSPGLLRQILRSGVGYDVCRFLFDGGAPQVAFVRVGNSPTQGTLALLAGGGATIITLTSQDWGSWVNAILVTVAAGPIVTLVYIDVFGNAFTEKWDFTGIGGLTPAVVAAAINGTQYGFAGSNYVTAVAGAGALPFANVSAVPLAGGTDGQAPIAGDWTNGLTALETQVIDFVLVATGDATIHAQALTHCQNMSAPLARRERIGVFGGLLGETVAFQTGTRMPGLRSARAQLIYPGMFDFNANGVQTLYDPFYAAAKIVGMHCAQADIATSLVHKPVPIIKAEVDLSTVQGGALDVLLQAGVSPIAPAFGGGYWLVDDLTGYNLPDQTWRDVVKTRSADFVAQWCRQDLESQFVGSKGLSSSQQAIAQAATTDLSRLQTMQIIKAFRPSVVEPGPITGSWSVSLPVMLIDTNKFIFLTVQLQPSSTAQGSTTSADALA